MRVVGLRRPRLAGGPWAFAAGSNQDLLDVDGITVDRLDVPTLGGPQPGTITEIGGHRVRVRAITDGALGFAGTLVFAPFEAVRDITGIPPGRCSVILVRFRPDREASAVLAQLRQLLPVAEVTPTAALSARTRRHYLSSTGIAGSFGFSTIIGTLVGIVIIMLTLYASVLTRSRDFAVLRALGAAQVGRLCNRAQPGRDARFGRGFRWLPLAGAASRGHARLSDPQFDAGVGTTDPCRSDEGCCLFGSLLAMRRALQAEPASVFH